MARGLPLLLVALALVTDTTCVSIGVIEEDPMRARETQAAVQAVLGKNDQVRLAGLEPGAVAALPHEFCRLAYEGVVGVISGATGAGSAVVRAAAARAGVPLFLTSDARASAAALPLPPHPRHVAAAAAALVRAKGWRRGVLVQEGGVGGAALLGGRAALTARVLPADPALLRNLLLLLKRGGERHVLVWASAERSAALLDAAQRAGMLDQRHVYLLLDLDLHTQSLANYSYAGANITGLRLFEPEAPAASIALDAWGRQLDERPQPEDAPTRVVLAVDAANLTLRAVSHLRLPNISDANCGTGEAAFHADTLLNYLRSEEWEGASGALAWTRDGARDAARLAVRELAAGGALAAAGRWLPGAGLRWTRPQLPAPPSPSDSMTNRTFTILIAENEPYVMKQESTHRLSGNQRYEGFCIELIAHLANQLGFNYTFEEQRDKQYGSFNNLTNKWNGMLGRLLEDKDIHFAITDLTITEQREKIVDFTTPFMNLGISILFHTPLPPKPKIFAFLLPFSNDVWICLGMSYLLTSLVLWIVGRLCPAEWVNPHPCVEDPPTLHNQFTLPNALWFNLGAVLLQGSEIAPVGYGTRAVASVWWVFALVITSSYTANLATLLAKKSSTELISNVDDLVNNTYGITYGAKKGGSTMDFFAQATSGTYKLMYQHMMEHPENLPTDNKEGIDRVNNAEGSYAFLMESTTIEYATERNCNITQVGALLDNKGYGIAMRKNSPYRQELSLALLNLQEQGVLREMKRTWWKEKHGGGACSGKESYESEKLDMDNFLGLWLVLVVGCALGVVMSLADLALAARRRRLPTETFLQRLALELRFVFRFHLSVKPVNGPLLSSSDTSTTEEADSGREEAESGRGESGSARNEAGSGRNTADDGRRADAAGGRDTAERGRDAAWSRRASRRSSLAAADARRRRHSRRS